MDYNMGYTGVALDAYQMGYNEMYGLDPVDFRYDMDGYTSGARYTNIILPELRAMAGYEDSGAGTWQQLTGEAQETAPYVLDELVGAFMDGMYQANVDNENRIRVMDRPPEYDR
jgi:hypothetical protein